MPMHVELSPKKLANFWKRVNKDGPTPSHRPELGPCWVWTGSLGPRKSSCHYGTTMVKRKTVRAHRVSWCLANGDVPDGLCVLHHCDNTRCVRPSHLFLGTPTDNMMDKCAKGRQSRGKDVAAKNPAKGEHNGFARLTVEQVEGILRDRAAGLRLEDIAKKVNVTTTQVSRICRRVYWRHVSVPDGVRIRENLKGANNPASKLTDAMVRIIREEYASGTTGAELARRFGITKTCVGNLLRHRTWKHVL